MPRSGRLPGYISGMPFSKRSKLFAIGWHRSGAHGAVRNAIQAAPDQPSEGLRAGLEPLHILPGDASDRISQACDALDIPIRCRPMRRMRERCGRRLPIKIRSLMRLAERPRGALYDASAESATLPACVIPV
jgi:hypothetical protein